MPEVEPTSVKIDPAAGEGPDAALRHDDPDGTVTLSKTKRLGPIGWLAIIWLGLVALMAFVPQLFPVPGLTERFPDALRDRDFGPTAGHPLGFDTSGRDLLSKLVYGTRASMIVSVLAVTFGLIVGGTFGLIAGYFRGKIDTVITNAFNVGLAIPQLVLAITLAAVFASDANAGYGQRVLVVTFAIGFASIPILGRITRANTLTWANREFVMAAKTVGARTPRIIIREVLPNVAPAMFSIALLGIAIAIVVEGGLALIGVGIPADITSPSWGNLIATGRSQMLLGEAAQVMTASLMVFFTVLSLNYLGDVVRARFDVRDSAL
ncbi:ABC transporter permease [Acidimicrobiia bacterium EGI L10123]|uniref:ABC transporter permease n=1 Tax=Salinilacustrithrix flava TaxID=2957203 RepID=UPI003D7C291E|nr:ABC transporter permease [Acidimicrobiia bacterium EGI L10123]